MILRARLLALCLALCAFAAMAAQTAPPPVDLQQRAGWDQHVGARVPVTLRLRDAQGRSVTLAQLAGGKPLLLALGYYRCPNLCGMVLHGLGDAVGALPGLQVGRDYEVAFVSIAPEETAADARQAQARLERMHPAGQVGRWHLLTGETPQVRALADAVGFHYFHDPRIDQYAHPAGAVVLTGGERVAQYFFGSAFAPAALRLALVDAARGQLGGVVDQIVLLCSGYDPTTGRYSLLISRVMQLLGAGFVLLAGGGLVAWRWRARRRQRRQALP